MGAVRTSIRPGPAARAFGAVVTAVTGPRGRWVTIAVWFVLAAVGAVLHGRLSSVAAAGQTSFLPAHSQSTRAASQLKSNFRGGESVPLFVLFDRPTGLTARDRAAIGRIGIELQHLGLDGASPVFDPLTTAGSDLLPDGVGLVSRDGEAAIIALGINSAKRGAVPNAVNQIQKLLRTSTPPGLGSYITGPAGLAADLDKLAAKAGTTLLIVTVALVLILLFIVYRAPFLTVLPLIVVGAAYFVVSGIVYLLADGHLITIDTESTLLLLVLIFGAGTDYSLLLVHRYREALGAGTPALPALRQGAQASAPAIGASAATVIAAMLVLMFASLESTRWLGPVLAIGIAVMLVASFTLMPALLSALGPRSFWPRPLPQASEPHVVWTRVAGLIRRRAAVLCVVIVAALAALACGNLLSHGTIGVGQGQIGRTNYSTGTRILDRHFPAGLSGPLIVLVQRADTTTVLARLNRMPLIKLAAPVPAQDRTGSLDMVVAVTTDNPYTAQASDAFKLIDAAVHRIDPGALLGGVPAENYDIQQANARDTKLIVPLVLAVVFVILCVLLAAIAAPLYLIATVVASFAATLGLVTLLFTHLFGHEGLAFNLVLISFIFLVALGVDYNIFLMDRVRREARMSGTREGTLRALTVTGGVVTSAGMILAGTFAALTLLPLEPLVQIGAAVALGVLIDTLVVRAVLVPSLTYLVGDRAWWPSRMRAARRDRAAPASR
jgi:putative drug exporter of the RND superfamily